MANLLTQITRLVLDLCEGRLQSGALISDVMHLIAKLTNLGDFVSEHRHSFLILRHLLVDLIKVGLLDIDAFVKLDFGHLYLLVYDVL